jgi:hypothetical protein
MLINKGASVGDVVTMKLVSGEELLGTLREETDSYVKVSKLKALTSTKEGLGMMQYVLTVDPEQDIKVNRAVIIMMEPTDKEFASSYTKATTGLIL